MQKRYDADQQVQDLGKGNRLHSFMSPILFESLM